MADVAEIYTQGWKLGLKALAIYRDNCKVGQPLSAVEQEGRRCQGRGGRCRQLRRAPVVTGPVRRRLPKKRPSQTVSFTVGGAEGYLTTGSYPDDGLGEVFIKLGKQGSTLAGVMDAFSIAVSVGLQYGIPLESYVAKFTNLRFEPAGMTDDPDVRIATSVMDYLFRRIALDYLPVEKRAELGIFSAAERTAQVSGYEAAVGPTGRPTVADARPPRRPRTSPRSSRICGRRWTPRRSRPANAEAQANAAGRRRSPTAGRCRRTRVRYRRFLDRTAGVRHRQVGRRSAVHHLRNEDAPVRGLLRVRGLRLDLRLQLRVLAPGGLWTR